MKVVLTGASSFSGYWFAKTLAANGHEVVMPLRAASVESYSGMRGIRVQRLLTLGRVVTGMEFGSEMFLAWLRKESAPDLFCHHASSVSDHKAMDFDCGRALAANVRGFPEIAALLSRGGCRGIVVTGTYYEPDEGDGSTPLEGFSPYALSKSLSFAVARYYGQRNGLAVGKFVMPNPFGPLENKGFTYSMIQRWISGQAFSVQAPEYVRDNIHVDLLALAYEAFCRRVFCGKERFARTSPSGYVENQGLFAQRFQSAVGLRTSLACGLEICRQTEFNEPLNRHNLEPAAAQFPQWSESAAWDGIAVNACKGEPCR